MTSAMLKIARRGVIKGAGILPINRFTPAVGTLPVQWVQASQDAWLTRALGEQVQVPAGPRSDAIERLANSTNAVGAKPVWEAYGTLDGYSDSANDKTREPNQVRTSRIMGAFFTWLVRERRPSIVVEFGTAFGVSGMYWLAGLEANANGKLITFEPNAEWARLARQNLSRVGSRYQSIVGTFEANIDAQLSNGDAIDIAFIDAIHTSQFVQSQYELVVDRLSPGGLVLLDDIDFSGDMAECWERLANEHRVRASAVLGRRVGIIEL